MNRKMLSICIPTCDRPRLLANCLNSIRQAGVSQHTSVEICISDNSSSDETERVVKSAADLPIKYVKNKTNIGLAKNFVQVVNLSEGEFCWLVGDDDLLMPDALGRLIHLIDKNPSVDFFYVNAYIFDACLTLVGDQPFDSLKLLNFEMTPFSSYSLDGPLKFLDLINPKISFDFLGGMYLSVFRRNGWLRHATSLSPLALNDSRVFSHFDNTFPHLKIFAHAFSNSMAYFNRRPLLVSLGGAREWSPMYPLITSVRLPEALKIYRDNGLSLYMFFICKNSILSNFWPDMLNLFVFRRIPNCSGYYSGVQLFFNALYPSSFLSVFFNIYKRVRRFINRVYKVLE